MDEGRTIHHVGNSSTTDDCGRLTQFRVQALCGLRLHPNLRLTDQKRQVTCGNCKKTIAIWNGRARE